jgi:hypothetical protein
VSSPRYGKKLDKSQEFLYVDFLPSFLPDIRTLKGTIRSSLEAGKNTELDCCDLPCEGPHATLGPLRKC